MNFKLEQEFSKTDIIHQVDELKKQIDAMRPLPADVEGKVMQKLRLDWNYHSNAIEGNRLTYGETVAFLMEGITAKGKPFKDYLDIKGHNKAILFLLSIVKDERALTESDIRALHKMTLGEEYEVSAQTIDGSPTTKIIKVGEYKTSANHVKTATGETHYYATPEETPAKMQELMGWYNEILAQKDIHPLVIAALFHHKFVAIHPFDDGNGRLSRILMNLILMQNAYPPVVIKMDDRTNYYSLLSRADNNDNWPFVEYIAENMVSSLNLYLKAAKGEDIDEDDDIEKEIALFRREINDEIKIKKVKSYETVKDTLVQEIQPFLNKFYTILMPFKDDFIGSGQFVFGQFTKNDFNIRTLMINDDLLNRISKNFDKLKFVEFHFILSKFRNPDYAFDIMIMGKIVFEYYDYKIYSNDDKVLITKLYHESLTSIDQNKIIKSFYNVIKNEIKSYLNQQSP